MRSKRQDFLIDADSESDSNHEVGSESLPEQRSSAKKRHKTKPLELPSSKPVSRFRQIVKGTGRKPRDPRFDNLSGEFDRRVFSQTYRFLDDVDAANITNLKKSLKKCKSVNSKAAVKESLETVLNRKAIEDRETKLQEDKDSWYKEERQRVKEGKKPFFLKKSDMRKMQLIDKFKSLKQSGSVDKFLAKRRKKNAANDHRWLARE